MSRSGYCDDYGDEDFNNALAFYRLNTERAMFGKRGQTLFKELLQALDEMPVKRLIKEDLKTKTGEVCALGALGVKRNIPNLEEIDPEDADYLAKQFGVAHQVIREIEFINDDEWGCAKETPEQRWQRMRNWVAKQIKS